MIPKPWLRWLLPFVLAFALAGCASTPPVDTKDETVSLVFGYFDMKDAPSSLDWVSLKQYDSKKKDGGWYTISAKDGLFFHVGIEPGSYQVDKFGGTGGIPLLTRRPFEYSYGGKGRNATAVRIRKPGVYFLGAHQYVNHAGKGMFEPDKFDMKVSKTPSRRSSPRSRASRRPIRSTPSAITLAAPSCSFPTSRSTRNTPGTRSTRRSRRPTS